jgi:hypothetical protein
MDGGVTERPLMPGVADGSRANCQYQYHGVQAVGEIYSLAWLKF